MLFVGLDLDQDTIAVANPRESGSRSSPRPRGSVAVSDTNQIHLSNRRSGHYRVAMVTDCDMIHTPGVLTYDRASDDQVLSYSTTRSRLADQGCSLTLRGFAFGPQTATRNLECRTACVSGRSSWPSMLVAIDQPRELAGGPVALTVLYFYDEAALDIDNILKPIQDALVGIVLEDDR